MPGQSRSRLKSLIEEGAVTVGGVTLTEPSQRVKPGQSFAILLPEARPASPEAQAIPLTVLFEDAYLIVVDKPAGLVVHPAPGNEDMTLVNALLAHCGPSLTGIGGVMRPGIVHRLDKDTSGVMVAAKTEAAHAGLSEQFAARTVERMYIAFVRGHPLPPAGEIEGAIGRHPIDRKRMAVVGRNGKPALTRYRAVARYGTGKTAAAQVECRLATGRTHQIRVHMAHAGWPLIGDPLYGGRGRQGGRQGGRLNELSSGLGRQALHAMTLGFVHPVEGETLRFASPLPPDMEALEKALADDFSAENSPSPL